MESRDLSIIDLFVNLKKLVSYLLTKWLWILSFGILGASAGFLYAYTRIPLYTASCTFVLEEGDSGGGMLGAYSGVASMIGLDVGGGGGIFQGENIIELYKSRAMVQKTLLSNSSSGNKNELLIDKYIAFNKLKSKWDSKSETKNVSFHNQPEVPFNRLQDSLIGTIVEDINMRYLLVSKPNKKLNIIQVKVKASDEQFAKEFNDKLVANVNDFYVLTKSKKSLQNVSILQRQADSIRNVLNNAIHSTLAVNDATPNLNITRQVLREPGQRSQINAETNKAILTELVKNLELSKIALRKEMPLIQIIDVPILPLEKDKASKLIGLLVGGFISTILTVLVILFQKVTKVKQ
jgi:hypothetical protein